jgi:hypothetical protein
MDGPGADLPVAFNEMNRSRKLGCLEFQNTTQPVTDAIMRLYRQHQPVI